VKRGVFGAPTFFVGEEMFFGQDRLDWVEVAAKS
jgi:2-hydroxychromene-2-carboxylate isomerase